MKKTASHLLIMFALLFSAIGVSTASTVQKLMSGTIPFAFAIGNRTLPAGRYDVVRLSSPGILMIQSVEKKLAIGALTQRAVADATPQKCRLEFRRYGDQYFLAHIWVKGNSDGYELPKSRAERRTVEQLKHIAGVAPQPEIVTITAE